jgi:hypothetical protein
LKNAFLGSIGLFAGFIGCAYTPWQRKAVATAIAIAVLPPYTKHIGSYERVDHDLDKICSNWEYTSADVKNKIAAASIF